MGGLQSAHNLTPSTTKSHVSMQMLGKGERGRRGDSLTSDNLDHSGVSCALAGASKATLIGPSVLDNYLIEDEVARHKSSTVTSCLQRKWKPVDCYVRAVHTRARRSIKHSCL